MTDMGHNPGEQYWQEFIDQTYSRVRSLPVPVIPANADCSIVLMEPRLHPNLEYVLRNTLYFAGEGWGLEIFAGPENWDYLKNLTRDWGTVRFHDLQTENLGSAQYNSLKKSADTWRRLSAETLLWIELDCLLVQPGIGKFLEWDYIGAPWRTEIAISPNCRVGNGGLSLRSRSAMLRIAEASIDNPIPNPSVIFTEDLYFCINMQLCNQQRPGSFKIPDVETAAQFSVESIYSPSPIGLHKTWSYLTPQKLELLLGLIDYG
ncbi:MAG: hypothetical protein BMS9Abin25_0257 [Gammaproteobacteria bacterium]|nr:MAG: hypothetical protein BMS9Abin25_0257 [Gammaproteobacteria bacterium]